MITFSTVDELVRILDADPQMAESLRARVLTRELLDLPETVARLTARVDEFSAAAAARFEQSDRRIDALEKHMEKHFEELNKRMEALDKRMDTLDNRMNALDKRMDTLDSRMNALDKRVGVLEKQIAELTKRVELLEKRFEAFERRVDRRFDVLEKQMEALEKRVELLEKRLDDFEENVNARFDALEERVDELDRRTERRFQRVFDDLSILRAAHARNAAREQAPSIVEDMGLQWIRNLKVIDILNMIAGKDTSDIPRNLMRRFRRADLFVETTDAQGETCYVAVEVSYTADERDTDRAITFAGYLNRFTQRSTYPAVASLRMDNRIEGLVESGSVFWYEMLPEDLQIE